jgi:HEAT repeat protein
MVTTIDELKEQLHDPRDWRVRKNAVKSLSEFKTAQAMEAIGEALYDESPHVVQAAANQLRDFGKDAVPALLEALYSKEEIASRPFIIHALRKLEDRELVTHFIHFLSDESPGMRYAAALALAAVPDERATQPLLNALQNEEANPVQIIKTLNVIGDPRTVPYVGGYLTDDDFVTCRYTAIMLARLRTPEAQTLLLDASQNERPDVRRAAVEGLGIFNSDKTFQRVVEMLHDGEASVQISAIMALGPTGRDEAVSLLVDLARVNDRRKYPYIRGALGDTGDLRAVLPLLMGFHDGRGLTRLAEAFWEYRSRGVAISPSIFEAMNSDDIRLRICTTWVFHSVSFNYAPPSDDTWVRTQLEHLDEFVPLLHDQDSDVRLATLVCLSEAALPKLPEQIIQLLDDDDLLIQEMATKALGHVNTTESFDALSQLVNRSHDKVRRQAINSLIRAGDDKAVHVLLALLDHEDLWTRRLAVRGLGSLKSTDSVPQLIKKLHTETDQTMKSAIIWTLGDIGDPNAVLEIIKALDTEDSGVFTESPFDSALYALQLNNNEDALSTLYQIVNNGSRWQRRMSAVEAIARIGSDQTIANRMFELLEHENETVRTTASKELGYLGARTSDLDLRDYIVSNLIERLHDTGAGYHWSPTVAHMAAKSLYYVGTTEAIHALKMWRQKNDNDEGLDT